MQAQTSPQATNKPAQTTETVDFYKREASLQDRETLPFKAGEQVRLKGSVHLDNDGTVRIDPMYDGGLRPSARTQFKLGSLEQNPELKSLLGGTAELTIGIERHEENVVAHIYTAKLTGDVAPQDLRDYSADTLKKASGRSIGIEGKVKTIKDQEGRRDSELLLELKDGTEVCLTSNDRIIEYSSGSLENSRRTAVAVGDTLRATVFVHPSGTLNIDMNVHMSEPNPARAREYAELRKTVGEQVARIDTAIQSGNFAGARNEAGKLAELTTTRSERKQVYEMLSKLPEAERPIFNEETIKFGIASKLSEAYGESVLEKTKSEFIQFALRLGTGKDGFKEGVDESTVYRLMDGAGVSSAEEESVYKAAIEALKPRVAGIDDKLVTFKEKFMLDQGIRYLATINSDSSADYLVTLLKDQVTAGNFRPAGWKAGDPKTGSIVFTLSTSILHRAAEKGGLEALDKHLGALVKLEAALGKVADEPVAQGELAKTIAKLKQRREVSLAFDELKVPSIGRDS